MLVGHSRVAVGVGHSNSFFSLYKIRYKLRLFYRTGICIILLFCIVMKNIEFDISEKVFGSVFTGWPPEKHKNTKWFTFCKKDTFYFLNDQKFNI